MLVVEEIVNTAKDVIGDDGGHQDAQFEVEAVQEVMEPQRKQAEGIERVIGAHVDDDCRHGGKKAGEEDLALARHHGFRLIKHGRDNDQKNKGYILAYQRPINHRRAPSLPC